MVILFNGRKILKIFLFCLDWSLESETHTNSFLFSVESTNTKLSKGRARNREAPKQAEPSSNSLGRICIYMRCTRNGFWPASTRLPESSWPETNCRGCQRISSKCCCISKIWMFPQTHWLNCRVIGYYCQSMRG